jgi:hypothetical protein
MQGQLDLVWKHLLPAFDAKSPQAADLSQLKTLKLMPPKGRKTSPTLTHKPYQLETNALGLQTVSFAFEGDRCVFKADAHSITCGLESWNHDEAVFPGTPPRLISGGRPKTAMPSKIAASATWTDDTTLVLTWRYYETPHSDTLTCKFDGDGVTITFLNSITAMNPKAKDLRAPLKGRAIA